MSVRSRQKACIACAESKRRCDRQRPHCQRCLDREIGCQYPLSRFHRGPAVSANDALATTSLSHVTTPGELVHAHSIRDFQWELALPTDIDALTFPSFDNEVTIQVDAQDLAVETQTFREPVHSVKQKPWFLQAETWKMYPGQRHPECSLHVDFDPLVKVIETMLRDWVEKGSNSFIHNRLYSVRMPSHLQNAFTATSAFMNATGPVRNLILQIIEERSCELVESHFAESAGMSKKSTILNQLAYVQALFVYVFLRLFDKSIRHRATAQQQIETLRLWNMELWQTSARYASEDNSIDYEPAIRMFDVQFRADSELWCSWIITESVRRTCTIVNTVLNIFEFWAVGASECNGAVMVTARKGLWDARSVTPWLEQCSRQDPLLIPALQPHQTMSQYAFEEIDTFLTTFWVFLAGSDRMQCWEERSVYREKEMSFNAIDVV